MRWIALIVSVLALTGCATTSQSERQLTQISSHYASLDSIWSGYHLSERILGVYDASGVVIVTTGKSNVTGFEPLSSGLWRLHNPDLGLQGSFYINYELNGEQMTLVQQRERSDFISFLIHEDFHGYQRDWFASYGGSTLSAADIGDMPLAPLIASIRLERGLLISALEATTKFDRVRALTAYISLREWRNEQLPDTFREMENRTERVEGSAHWVELNADVLILGQSDIQQPLRNSLGRDHEARTGNLSTALLTHRLYPTGAALLELANKLGIEHWQAKIESGSSPYQLIREHISIGLEELSKFQEEMIHSPAFSREVRRAERLQFGTSGEELYQTLRQRYQHEVRFFIPATLNEAGEAILRSSFSMQQAAPFAKGLAMDPVEQFTHESPIATIQVNRTPIILWNPPFLDEQGEETPGSSFSIFTNRITIEGETVGAGDYLVIPNKIQIRGVRMQGEQKIRLEVR